MDEERMLDVSAAAKRLSTSAWKVYVLIAGGDLVAIDIASSGAKRPTWRIPETALLEFMSKRSKGAPRGMQTRAL